MKKQIPLIHVIFTKYNFIYKMNVKYNEDGVVGVATISPDVETYFAFD